MRIGSSLFLIALGAILAWAVKAEVPYVSLDLIGYILMGVGVIGLIWSLITMNNHRVTETRSVHDPHTGERVTRSEASDSPL